jgi:YegS/Rv2252/BmrU family lipid kinase
MQEEQLKKKSILFIINPISGAKRGTNLTASIKKHLDKRKFNLEFKYTEYAGHAIELSKTAVEKNTDVIVAVGGDGTINEVASQMIGSKSVLGIVPLGSGNGLARHLGIPRLIPSALRLINDFQVTDIDTASINGVPFISIAGVGFDAKIAKLFARVKRRGFFTYANLITNNYIRYKPKKYKLEFDDGTVIVTRALFISFANSNQFGYNTTIAPNAQLRDGQLDICIVQKPNIFTLPIIANLMLLRAIDKSQYVETIRASHFFVSQSRNRVVNIDGEASRIDKKLEITVNPLSLQVIIPDHEIK